MNGKYIYIYSVYDLEKLHLQALEKILNIFKMYSSSNVYTCKYTTQCGKNVYNLKILCILYIMYIVYIYMYLNIRINISIGWRINSYANTSQMIYSLKSMYG